MLFKRRDRETALGRLRVWFWPRVSWRRSVTYFAKRTLRLSGTPHAIALGCAIGAFVSFTPFLGLHFILAVALAWLLGANMIAGALGTFVGNPITFPLIWAGTYELGRLILPGVDDAADARFADASGMSFGDLLPLLEPMLVGSVPLGLIAGATVYLLAYKAVLAYQDNRRARLLLRRSADAAAE